MPTYQYACTACEERLEAQQSFTDDALTVCPSCDGRLRKVFNAVGIVFKGSGFYRTDSRAAPANGTAESGSAAESTSSESKPGPDSGDGSGPSKDSGTGKASDKSPDRGSTKSPTKGSGSETGSSGASGSSSGGMTSSSKRGRGKESAA